MSGHQLIVGDCARIPLPDRSVDLVVCSPPYEDARLYGLGFKLRGQAWVDWALPRYMECLRVSRGLVAWVVEGRTKKFRWSATPALLLADLHRAGVHLRKPAAFARVGIPGSGGPDWWRNDWEFVVCATNGGKLPWSDNTATGHPPRFKVGGACSNRNADGRRYNKMKYGNEHVSSSALKRRGYAKPKLANPGNIIRCNVGGGQMGHKLAHENEASFPESLVEPFVRCFCPPGGLVLDPFCGSGTTLAAAHKWGRRGIGLDVRESQIELAARRLADIGVSPVVVVRSGEAAA